MNIFGMYNPYVNFIYFALVLSFSMLLMHPICLAVSLFCALAYSAVQKGSSSLKFNAAVALPVIVFTTIINPIFNHGGVTVIAYLPSGNPLTAEAIAYGAAAGAMLASVICWFSCFNTVMTSDKLIYLFGRILPSFSLIFSMSLRFVPKFRNDIKDIAAAQQCIGQGISGSGIISRARHGTAILSIMITRVLEGSIDTADSMKCRGYGLNGRTAYSICTFTARDCVALTAIIFLGIYMIYGIISGGVNFDYFPAIFGEVTPFSVSLYAAYFLLCALPMIIEATEEIKWNVLKSKI